MHLISSAKKVATEKAIEYPSKVLELVVSFGESDLKEGGGGIRKTTSFLFRARREQLKNEWSRLPVSERFPGVRPSTSNNP